MKADLKNEEKEMTAPAPHSRRALSVINVINTAVNKTNFKIRNTYENKSDSIDSIFNDIRSKKTIEATDDALF